MSRISTEAELLQVDPRVRVLGCAKLPTRLLESWVLSLGLGKGKGIHMFQNQRLGAGIRCFLIRTSFWDLACHPSIVRL